MKYSALALSVGTLFIVALGCSRISNMATPQAKPFIADSDNFYITFPSGTTEPSANPDPEASTDNKTQIYSTVNANVGYRVKAISIGGYSDDYLKENFSVDDVANTAMEVRFPWKDKGSLTDLEMPPKDAARNNITYRSLPAIESTGWTSELSSLGNMFKRIRLIWDAPNKKAYSIEVFSKKKEDLNSDETNKFYESFSTGKPAK